MIIFLLIVSSLTGWPTRPYLIWLWYLSPSSSTWFLSFTSSKSHWLLAYLWPLRHTTPAWNSQPQKHTESKLTLSALISPLQRPGYPDHPTYHTLSLSPNFLSSFLPMTYHHHNLEYVYLPLSISLVGGKLQEGRDFVYNIHCCYPCVTHLVAVQKVLVEWWNEWIPGLGPWMNSQNLVLICKKDTDLIQDFLNLCNRFICCHFD